MFESHHLAGVAGYAVVFIKSCPWIGSVNRVGTLQERFTLTFVGGGRTTSLRDRRVSEVELLELRDFFKTAATEDFPHISVAGFETMSGALWEAFTAHSARRR